MTELLSGDPGAVALRVALAVGVVAVAILLWRRLLVRVRQLGGGRLAGLVVGAGIAGLLLAIVPGLLSPMAGLALLIISLAVIYRIDLVVRYTGGPAGPGVDGGRATSEPADGDDEVALPEPADEERP